MTGKGSDPRPLSVSLEEFAVRWQETFGTKPTLSQIDEMARALKQADDEPETDQED